MKNAPSLAGRAVLSVFLMIGFYVLAFALIAVLVYLPIAEITLANRIHFKLLLFCGIGAVVIFWSILPRFDRFIPTGKLVKKEDYPELFREIEGIAAKLKQEMPSEVYLDMAMNAWVANRGGVMGFGSRRVMCLGLPLLDMLTVQEFRGVVAHEFGHYHGGDTKLAPWVYKTRSAIMRTLQNLSKHSGFLQMPFIWYGNMFLKVTQSISRAQEFTADRLGAEIAGKAAMISGLQKVSSTAPAYDAYWNGEVVPVLDSGHLPPISEGFRKYLNAPEPNRFVGERLKEEMASGLTGDYDSHPPLSARIENIRATDGEEGNPGGDTASGLVRNLTETERDILAVIAGKETADRMKNIRWENIVGEIYLPGWKKARDDYRAFLSEIRASALPEIAGNFPEWQLKIEKIAGQALDGTVGINLANWIIGSSLSLILLDRGWKASADPGTPVTLARDGKSAEPFKYFLALKEKKMTPDDWKGLCSDFGISDTTLA